MTMEQRIVHVTAWAKVLEPHDISNLTLEDLLWIGGGCDVVRYGLAQEHGLGLVLAIFWNLASVSYLEYSVTALDS